MQLRRPLVWLVWLVWIGCTDPVQVYGPNLVANPVDSGPDVVASEQGCPRVVGLHTFDGERDQRVRSILPTDDGGALVSVRSGGVLTVDGLVVADTPDLVDVVLRVTDQGVDVLETWQGGALTHLQVAGRIGDAHRYRVGDLHGTLRLPEGSSSSPDALQGYNTVAVVRLDAEGRTEWATIPDLGKPYASFGDAAVLPDGSIVLGIVSVSQDATSDAIAEVGALVMMDGDGQVTRVTPLVGGSSATVSEDAYDAATGTVTVAGSLEVSDGGRSVTLDAVAHGVSGATLVAGAFRREAEVGPEGAAREVQARTSSDVWLMTLSEEGVVEAWVQPAWTAAGGAAVTEALGVGADGSALWVVEVWDDDTPRSAPEERGRLEIAVVEPSGGVRCSRRMVGGPPPAGPDDWALLYVADAAWLSDGRWSLVGNVPGRPRGDSDKGRGMRNHPLRRVRLADTGRSMAAHPPSRVRQADTSRGRIAHVRSRVHERRRRRPIPGFGDRTTTVDLQTESACARPLATPLPASQRSGPPGRLRRGGPLRAHR